MNRTFQILCAIGALILTAVAVAMAVVANWQAVVAAMLTAALLIDIAVHVGPPRPGDAFYLALPFGITVRALGRRTR